MKVLLEAIFSPIGVMTVFLCVGGILDVFRRKSQWGHRFMLIGVIMLFVFLFSPLAEFFVNNLERSYQPLINPPISGSIKKIVVLSGYAEQHSNIPLTSNLSEHTLCRIAEGIRIYRSLPGSSLLLSGGSIRPGDKPVARIMADFLREMGIPEEDILVEEKSVNTYENLVEVKKIIGSDPFILVTSAYGLRRAMGVARKLEMRPVAAPACIRTLQHYPPEMDWVDWLKAILNSFSSPSAGRLTYLQLAYHEYLGYAWYKLLGRI